METDGTTVDAGDDLVSPPADPAVDHALARIRQRMFGNAGVSARIGRFEILRELGRGGMGVVYEAHDPALDRKVAIKLVRVDRRNARAGQRQRLLREAQALARLSHPNVVPVFEVGTGFDPLASATADDDGASVFIAMELVAGVTVRRWLAARPRDWRDIVHVFVQAGRGVAAAHDAAIIHCDLKPDNVMVGDDGRVRVLDFGLAQAAGYGDVHDVDGRPVEGTPAYMAPEQLHGEAADARADQFGLCAALFESLWGTRPFAGDTLSSVRSAIERGRIVDAEPTRRVPRPIRAIVLRGLERDPRRRWPDVDSLVDALERCLRRRSRALAFAGLLGLSGIGWFAVDRGEHDRCAEPHAELVGVWDENKAGAIADAFSSSGVADGAGAWARVRAEVDEHMRAWGEAWQEICRARSGRFDETLERRATCLDQRLREVRALGDVLARADAPIVREAPKAVQALSSIASCRDDAALSHVIVPPPSDPYERASVLAAREQIADATGLLAFAQYEDALAIAGQVVEIAREIGHAPLEAEARLLHGRVTARLGRTQPAIEQLEGAVAKAIEGDHPEVLAMAASELTYLEGYLLARHEAGERWAALAVGAVARADRDGRLEAQRLQNLGSVRLAAGDAAAGLSAYRQAAALAETALGADHPRVAGIRTNIAAALLVRGDVDAALEELERARSVVVHSLGPDHPDVALVEAQMASAHQGIGHHEEALAGYDRALAVYEASAGMDHPHVAKLLMNSGVALTKLERFDEALARHERARSLISRTLGADHPQMAQLVHDIGQVHHARGDHARARELLADALERKQRLHGPEHISLATSLRQLGIVNSRLGREGRSFLLRALAIYAHNPQHDPRERADAERELAELELRDADRLVARE